MAMRDEDFGATLTLTEADGGLWSPPKVAPASETRDWRSLYEQAQARAGTERARADAAEARCEELRRAESDARSRAGSLKWALDKSRHKLQEAVEDLKEVRRASKDALFFQAEVTRLEKLLSQAGVDSRKRSTIVTLRMEVFQLREALQAPKPGKDTAGSLRREVDSLNREDARLGKALDRSQEQNDELAALRRKVAALRRSKRPAQASRPRASVQLRKALERAHKQKDTIKALRGEVGSLSRETRRLNREARRLRREQERLQDLKATVRWLTFETRLQRGELAGYHDQMDLIEAQESRIIGLHVALRTSAIKNEKLEAELAERPLLSAVFRTVRDRDKTIVSLHKEIARGRKANDRQGKKIKALRAHRARLQARIAQLRSTRAVLSKAVFGGRSERQETPRSERKRGQQRGAPGHGRTQRPTLEEKEDRQEPPEDARVCSCCGKPYVANGEHSSSVIEIAVKAHIRRIVRPRYRRGCDCPFSPLEVTAPPPARCPFSPLEVTAPPPARLFPRTPYGTSVWARILYERFACFRPLRQVAAWMTDQGLAIAPGTIAGSVRRFLPLFTPLAEAILAYQNEMAVRHADETGWRIQALSETGRSRRAWLWISVGKDAVYYHIDPSRSAEAAMKLFGSVKGTVFLVCDRYSAYTKMARELDGKVILCWCWVHQRRDFIECAAGQAKLTQWCEGWVDRFASVCRLNKERLKHYDPAHALERQTPAFDAAQDELKKAVDELFAQAEVGLADLPAKARQGKALRSLLTQASRGTERLRRQSPGPHGQQCRGARTPRGGHRKTAELRLRQRGRRRLHGDDVLGPRYPRLERHRHPALAGGVARSLRGEWLPAARRPVAVAALVDERGAQARVHRAGMTGAIECRYYGRDFTAEEMALLRALIATDPQPTRAALSREFCRRVGWLKPDGGLKDMMAKVTMLAMHRDGVITLPPPRGRQGRPKPIVFGPDTEPPLFPAPATLDEVRPLDMRIVVRNTREGKLWNEFVARYHYLGYKPLVGAQMRYAVHDRNGWPLAMLGFSTAAWKLAPRDRFIGWTPEKREKNLPLVVDNPRFLILPWIEIPNLGSHILAFVRRRLPGDWTERYNTTPVLIETFVETPRYTGAVYKASGWTPVGTTQGRGRYDRHTKRAQPKKDIWLRPLRKDWKRTLNR